MISERWFLADLVQLMVFEWLILANDLPLMFFNFNCAFKGFDWCSLVDGFEKIDLDWRFSFDWLDWTGGFTARFWLTVLDWLFIWLYSNFKYGLMVLEWWFWTEGYKVVVLKWWFLADLVQLMVFEWLILANGFPLIFLNCNFELMVFDWCFLVDGFEKIDLDWRFSFD